MSQQEKTLILFKPDAVQRGLVGEILSRFEKVGLKIVGLKMLDAKEEQLAEHYFKDEEWKERVGKGLIKNKNLPENSDPIKLGQEIVDSLVKDMKLSPIIAMVLEGHNSIKTVRRLAGPTNIDEASPGTIRGDFAHDTLKLANRSNRPGITIIHATENPAEAEKEIGIWFNPSEIYSYTKPEEEVHYRKL